MNKTDNPTQTTYVVIQIIKNFISKIRQNPDIYPIRYYKKNKRFKRNYDSPAVK